MIDKKIEETARLDDEEYYDRLSDMVRFSHSQKLIVI